jgi:hypothetical protein
MKVAVTTAILAAFLCGFAAAQQSELLGPLNTGVNALLQAAGVANREASRVVPIVDSVGVSNGFAQIVGTQRNVNAVKAVLAVETHGGETWSITGFVPVTSVNRGGTPHRAYGVAIDAVIDRR